MVKVEMFIFIAHIFSIEVKSYSTSQYCFTGLPKGVLSNFAIHPVTPKAPSYPRTQFPFPSNSHQIKLARIKIGSSVKTMSHHHLSHYTLTFLKDTRPYDHLPGTPFSPFPSSSSSCSSTLSPLCKKLCSLTGLPLVPPTTFTPPLVPPLKLPELA